MKVSREQMKANRARILDEAGRLFRQHGFDAVTVSDIMKAAGQTHGGFYGHFASKDELVAQTMIHLLHGEGSVAAGLEAWIDTYLSPPHRDAPAQGCPTASLAGLMRGQTCEARAAMADGLAAQLGRLAAALPEGDAVARRREAIGTWAAMVGAVILSRSVDDAALAEEVLTGTRAWIANMT
ncbi:TetR/AcrR family transcriptional regulator [Sphingomonas abietis]|uniref:Helix-turn-helix domain containing protein n=1 Tax=Sphingomonas abietis TaxID=3012344 RepID=A0ABY7NIH4_9SPHN|nr:TetR/AcrR family transcriptional regulator [Sphingomonas abietis]WBO21326.1 helix-turn-helix domain containing protein [Sphingomonas abietis]